MQAKRAASLRKEWGNKPCSHQRFDREYILGADTGDYVCITCGQTFTKQQKEEIESNRPSN